MTHLIYPAPSDVHEYTKVQCMLLQAMDGNAYRCLILQYIMDWCRYNEKKPSAIKEGYAWFYHTEQQFVDHFRGSFSLASFQRHKEKLIAEGWLITGCFNKKKYDQTTWYRPNWERYIAIQDEESQKICQKKENDKKERKKRSPRSAQLEPIEHTLAENADTTNSPTSSCAPSSHQKYGMLSSCAPSSHQKCGTLLDDADTNLSSQTSSYKSSTSQLGIGTSSCAPSSHQNGGDDTIDQQIINKNIIQIHESITESPSGLGAQVGSSDKISVVEKKKKPAREKTDGSKVWDAYAEAYEKRYKIHPLRGKEENSICSRIVERVGLEEAILDVRYYLTINDNFYLKNRHPLKVFFANITTINANRRIGSSITTTESRRIEHTQTVKNTHDIVDQMISERHKKALLKGEI